MSASKYNNRVFRTAAAQLIKNVQQSLDEIGQVIISETDNNFRTKSFYGQAWKNNAFNSPTLVETGNLRQSVRVLIRRTNMIRVGSTEKYASIHNRGGRFTPSVRQKNFFWAMYKDTNNPVYKACALKLQGGGSIEIPQRQFIGVHPILTSKIKRVIYKNLRKKYG